MRRRKGERLCNAIMTAEPEEQRLRVDAGRNRAKIVTAAREALVEHGTDVPMDEIARRAGVGNATVYRNFPDRGTLIRTVMLSVMVRVTEQAETALAEEPDPLEALRRFVHASVDERIGALCPLLSDWVDPSDPDFVSTGGRMDEAVRGVIDAALATGRLRAGVAFGDIIIGLAQLARPLPGTGCAGIDAVAHRHVEIYLDGLRHPGSHSLPGEAWQFDDRLGFGKIAGNPER
ncbi:MAG: TetR/AcrR family transcriptional regulator [Frankia sp.]